MAITITESVNSRNSSRGPSAFAELVYHVSTDAGEDEGTVLGAIQTDTPTSYDGMPLAAVDMDEVLNVDTVAGNGLYRVRCRYEQPQGGGLLDFTGELLTWATGGGRERRRQAISTTGYVAGGGTAPDYGGAINPSESGVEGVDVVVPTFRFTINKQMANADVTSAFQQAVYDLTGKTNHAIWRGFGIGDVLFLGCNARQLGQNANWAMQFEFEARPTLVNIDIGGINVAEKRGHDYLWVTYLSQKDTTADRIVQKPDAAYVSQVYYAGDYTTVLPA